MIVSTAVFTSNKFNYIGIMSHLLLAIITQWNKHSTEQNWDCSLLAVFYIAIMTKDSNAHKSIESIGMFMPTQLSETD